MIDDDDDYDDDECEAVGEMWICRGETKALGENLAHSHFVHYKSQMTRPGIEPGLPRWDANH
jgi:hypothetical protein